MTTILEATQQLIAEGLIEQTNAPEPLENAIVALTDEGRTEAVALVHLSLQPSFLAAKQPKTPPAFAGHARTQT